jgi:hypothetical protein
MGWVELCVVEVLDRPLPRPADASYVEARLLEALVEAHLALRFLREGLDEKRRV